MIFDISNTHSVNKVLFRFGTILNLPGSRRDESFIKFLSKGMVMESAWRNEWTIDEILIFGTMGVFGLAGFILLFGSVIAVVAYGGLMLV